MDNNPDTTQPEPRFAVRWFIDDDGTITSGDVNERPPRTTHGWAVYQNNAGGSQTWIQDYPTLIEASTACYLYDAGIYKPDGSHHATAPTSPPVP